MKGELRLSFFMGAWLEMFSTYDTERRPRGASRAALAPTFVSGQFLLCEATELGAFAVLSASTS